MEWLDDGVDSHGPQYFDMRRRVIADFHRRKRPAAEDLADETLYRIGLTLQHTAVIETRPPARYCYIVARFVLLEDFRRERRHAPFDVHERRTTRLDRHEWQRRPLDLTDTR